MSYDASRAYDFGEPTPTQESEPLMMMMYDLKGDLVPSMIRWPKAVEGQKSKQSIQTEGDNK